MGQSAIRSRTVTFSLEGEDAVTELSCRGSEFIETSFYVRGMGDRKKKPVPVRNGLFFNR
jgi:hypothetical protein